MYLDTDHEICILYRAKIKSLYHDTRVHTIMLKPEHMDILCIVSYILYRDTYRISKSRIITPLDLT